MKHVLVIDNYDSFVYNLIGLLKEFDDVEYSIMKNDEIDFDLLPKFEYILLSPGPSIPKLSNDLLKIIDLSHKTHSILGVCLGHQAINEYFGGSIRKLSFPKHGHHSILKNINNRDILFKDIDKEIEVARYHSWTIDALGKDLEISSLDEDNNIMSVFHRKYKINGVQFHPESIITNCGKEIIRNWLANN